MMLFVLLIVIGVCIWALIRVFVYAFVIVPYLKLIIERAGLEVMPSEIPAPGVHVEQVTPESGRVLEAGDWVKK
jgi:hypothetical protein